MKVWSIVAVALGMGMASAANIPAKVENVSLEELTAMGFGDVDVQMLSGAADKVPGVTPRAVSPLERRGNLGCVTNSATTVDNSKGAVTFMAAALCHQVKNWNWTPFVTSARSVAAIPNRNGQNVNVEITYSAHTGTSLGGSAKGCITTFEQLINGCTKHGSKGKSQYFKGGYRDSDTGKFSASIYV
ncbi:hypothetical protein FQN55_009660 [Onygenales sp. PD_40]|nr:hypothetical protein FQN55_009660 [Onygenales sp. PD_40]KAK2792702.1 hypothetical protein FQN52_002763 [Onygenales sp. PD_12]KAK2799763.1 hypothetical protein FQN51_006689 [Onygenales sp. PD_10]